jgi:hypothetical protein
MRTPLTLIFLLLSGCIQVDEPADAPADLQDAAVEDTSDFPVFTLTLSEYPSWAIELYGDSIGVVNGSKGGKMGPIELARGVDIVLSFDDYETGMTMYSTGTADAVTITNMDILPQVEGRPGVAILPTSTSDKADTLLVRKEYCSWDKLKEVKVLGLSGTVSEYAFRGIAQHAGQNPDDYTYENTDPAVAATMMLQGEANAISVWNPFKRNVLNELGDDVCELGNSGVLPLQILDLIVVGQDALDKPGGEQFALALADVYYHVNGLMADPATRDETLVGISNVFVPLPLKDMEIIFEETRVFSTPQSGIELYTGSEIQQAMVPVRKFAFEHMGVPEELVVGYGTKADAPDARLRYDPSYMQQVAK